MPVLFTLDLPTDDEVEAQRWASVIREVRCDVHDEPPVVRATSPAPDRHSLFITGCCPQLYTVVTERLAREAIPSSGPMDGGDPAVSRKRRPFPTVV